MALSHEDAAASFEWDIPEEYNLPATIESHAESFGDRVALRFLSDDGLVAEIQTFMKEETAPYKYPRRIEFVDELPKTSGGKIRRVELRGREVDRFGR